MTFQGYDADKKGDLQPILAFMTVKLSHHRMIAICVLPNWLVRSRVNGEGRNEIVSCGHMMFYLMTRWEVISWSYDFLLSSHGA